MAVIEKAIVTVFLDEDNNPRGLVWFNSKARVRELFVATRADEEAIIGLIENKDVKLKTRILKAPVQDMVSRETDALRLNGGNPDLSTS